MGPNYIYRVIVTRVVDGDTVDVDIDLGFNEYKKDRVRLMGIDTPESRTRNLKEKALGLQSKARLKELIASAPLINKKRGKKAVFLKTTKDGKGKFGRILGEIFTPEGEVSINKQMCDEGYAVEYYGGNKDELVAKHQVNKEKLIAKGIITV